MAGKVMTKSQLLTLLAEKFEDKKATVAAFLRRRRTGSL